MAAALHVGVGQLIHQNQTWAAHQNAVQVKFPQLDSPVFDPPGRQHFQPGEQGHGLRPVVGLDIPGQHVPAGRRLVPRRLQHRIGFPHPGRVAEENFQPPVAVS